MAVMLRVRSLPLGLLLAAACTRPEAGSVSGDGGASGTPAGASTGGPEVPAPSTEGTTSSSDGDATETSAMGDGTEANGTSGASESSSTDASTGTSAEPMIGVFVHPAGLDANPGTAEAPVRTIQRGLQLARDEGLLAVHVAQGEYEASSRDGTALSLPSGLTLLGGYAAEDWSARDPAAHPTRILDPSTSGEVPPVLISLDAVTDVTVSGFELHAAPAGAVLEMYGGEATIADNVIFGRIELREDHVIALLGNRIQFLDGDPQVLRSFHPDPTPHSRVERNVITGTVYWSSGGTFSSNAISSVPGIGSDQRALVLLAGGTRFVGNSVSHTTGLAEPSAALTVYTDDGPSAVELAGNNIFAPFRPCLVAFSFSGDPPSWDGTAHHNNLSCGSTYQRRTGTDPEANNVAESYETVAGFEAAVESAFANVAVEDTMIDPPDDLHLAPAVPCSVSRGGVASGPMDLDGAARTDPFSIGAYEDDGVCA